MTAELDDFVFANHGVERSHGDEVFLSDALGPVVAGRSHVGGWLLSDALRPVVAGRGKREQLAKLHRQMRPVYATGVAGRALGLSWAASGAGEDLGIHSQANCCLQDRLPRNSAWLDRD